MSKMNPGADNLIEVMPMVAGMGRDPRTATVGTRRPDGTIARDSIIKASAAMREARLYEIDAATWAALYHAADRWTDETINGGEWKPAWAPSIHSESEKSRIAAAYQTGMSDLKEELPYPRLPFRSVYLAFGRSGHPLPPVARAIRLKRFHDTTPDNWHHIALMGVLMNDHDAWEVIKLTDHTGRVALSLFPLALFGIWRTDLRLTPWIVSIAMTLSVRRLHIEEIECKAFRRAFRQNKRAFGLKGVKKPLPPLYYRIGIESADAVRYMTNGVPATLPSGWELSHRFDVAAHERLYVRYPEPGQEPDYEERGYQLHAHPVTDTTVLAQLARRGRPAPGPGHSVAILTRFISDYVKGPENAPYVPANRATSP